MTATGPRTLTDVISELQRRGYTGDFAVAPSRAVRCLTCQATTSAEELVIDARSRLEGASDPADNSVVFALGCPACGTQGALVVRYGPEAGADEADLLAAIPRHLPEVAPADEVR